MLSFRLDGNLASGVGTAVAAPAYGTEVLEN